jgi:hypothetical protein
VANEQGFHLTQKIAGAERFDEQGVRVFSRPIFSVPMFSVPMFSVPMFSSPMFSRWRIGCEQRSRGIVSLAARGADDFQAGLFGFHAQVADDHVVNGGLHAGKGLGGTAGGFHFKSVEFENSFEGQQDGEIVVDKKNAAFRRWLSCAPPVAACTRLV